MSVEKNELDSKLKERVKKKRDVPLNLPSETEADIHISVLVTGLFGINVSFATDAFFATDAKTFFIGDANYK